MKNILLLLGLLFLTTQTYCQEVKDSISYSLIIRDYRVGLTVPLEKAKWVKNNFLGVEQTYYNKERDLQLVFNKDLLKESIKQPSDGLNYLINNFNSEYDLNKAHFTYNPKNKVYKCLYVDSENSFIIYLYFYDNYMIYTSFYSQKEEDFVGVLNLENQAFLDKIYFNVELQTFRIN